MTQVDFDPAALKRFLVSQFGEGPTLLERVAGGQSNPTYFVSHGNRQMVLRKQPTGPILRGAHAVDREFRVLEALHPTGVPVPRPIIFHEDPDLVGTPFYLMERVEGRVFPDGALAGARSSERHALWMALAEALGAMHRIRPDDIGLEDFGRPGNYFARQIARWSRQWEQSPHPPIPELDQLVAWLALHQPEDDGCIGIAHGDFRMGNVIFHPTEPKVVAILDWELSTLGHPMADLGYCCLAWHTSPDEYGGLLGLDLGALALPSEAEFVDRYVIANPDAVPLTVFHRVFALFRFAVIWVGIADRVRTGTAAGSDAPIHAGMAARLARRGVALIERS